MFTHNDIREGSYVTAPGKDKVVLYKVLQVGTRYGDNTFLGRDLHDEVTQVVSCGSIRSVINY